MPQKTAHLITEILNSVGVRRIYGVVGDSLKGIMESLRRRGDINWIHTRHEEAAAFAAGAEAHLTGKGIGGDANAGLLSVISSYWIIYCTYKLFEKFTDVKSSQITLSRMNTPEFTNGARKYVSK